MLQQLTNLAITQLGQLTVLIVIAGLLHRLLADRAPRWMLAIWTIVAIKAITPPVFASSWGVFSWIQAPAVAGIRPNQTLLAVDWSSGSDWLSYTFAAAVIAWGAGSVLVAFATWRHHRRLGTLMRRDALKHDDPLVRYANGLAEHHGLQAPDRIVVSRDELGPAVSGILRQTVLLPASLVEDRNPAALRPVLLHELVHVTRRDTWTALLHAAMRVVWWFNPFVWWASRRAESLVERCVDLTVTRDLRTSVTEYGRGLLRVLELRANLQPQADLAGLKPCQITTERLNFLSNDRNRLRRTASVHRYGVAMRYAVMAAIAVLVLPALPVDALTTKCDSAFATGCPLEATQDNRPLAEKHINHDAA
ncbi:MAG: M56 family metallopeptidase [Planctomycetota bacterium]